MKKYNKILSGFVGLFIWSIAASCGAAGYYSTMEQPSGASEQIKAATEFNVRAIDFSAINPKDLGYTNPGEWDTDRVDVPKAFTDAFPILLKEANMNNKKVNVIAGNDKIKNGIIVEVAVTQIILKWNFMMARPDEFICKITFTNAADGQKLYAGIVNVNSRAGNPFAQGWKASFSGRLNTAAYNMAWVLTKIMGQGKIDPADY
ncbi:MAG: hypothetical protein AB2L12_07085 [Smithellaceae bacterium]